MPPNVLGVPAHICAVGLYFRGDHLRLARYSPPKTKPCSRKHQDETVRKSSPQGVTIPNAKRASLRPPEFAQTVFTCHFYDLLHNGTDCNTPCECNDLHSCNCKLVHSSFSDLKMNEDSKRMLRFFRRKPTSIGIVMPTFIVKRVLSHDNSFLSFFCVSTKAKLPFQAIIGQSPNAERQFRMITDK
ncbi:hypothetical protein BGX14_0976 [Fibrobacter sp. UWS1]|nr:hypothetical protein BGX14_0976 [Fibrobacter sp. UWS1]